MDRGRRHVLQALGLALAGAPALAAAPRPVRLAATWRDGEAFHLGVLEAAGDALRVAASIELPTRAHGLLQQPGGRIVAVARRPGDWLLRWHAPSGRAEWHWSADGCTLNGHVRAGADGRRLFTTATDGDTGQGRVLLHDARTLEVEGAWSTHGLDPHDLRLDRDGSLLVANGGIALQPETGRAKLHLERMDSSLVRLAAHDGALRGQWRLADPRLGMRHLAWSVGEGPRRLAIALQAEHEDAALRSAAPVLALFDGDRLQAVPAPMALAGYGGDVAAHAGGFAVSCPRRDVVALFDGAGAGTGTLAARGACALAPADRSLWVGGQGDAVQAAAAGVRRFGSGLELDNHWLVLA